MCTQTTKMDSEGCVYIYLCTWVYAHRLSTIIVKEKEAMKLGVERDIGGVWGGVGERENFLYLSSVTLGWTQVEKDKTTQALNSFFLITKEFHTTYFCYHIHHWLFLHLPFLPLLLFPPNFEFYTLFLFAFVLLSSQVCVAQILRKGACPGVWMV